MFRTFVKKALVAVFLSYIYFVWTLQTWVEELIEKLPHTMTEDQLQFTIWVTIVLGIVQFVAMIIAWRYKWPGTVSWFHIGQGLIGLGVAFSASWILGLTRYGENYGILPELGAIFYVVGVICIVTWVFFNPNHQPEPPPKKKPR